MIEPHPTIRATRQWIESVVIGLNLCPFAKRVFAADKIRYTLTDATEVEDLRSALTEELKKLAAAPRSEIETAILIHPYVLTDFLDYNDFLSEAEELLKDLDLTGVIQIASFHPEYRFAGTEPDAVENFTNRSPYPMLHLLREESITEVADDPATLEDIPTRNIATLRALGREKLLRLLKGN